jgi:hypothetical protein
MKHSLLLAALGLLIWTHTASSQPQDKKKSQEPWTLTNQGPDAIGVVFPNKLRPMTITDTRLDRQGRVWGSEKVTLNQYPRPVLVAIFGHGMSAYYLKVIDPLVKKNQGVLLEVSSDKQFPTHKLIKKGQKEFLEIQVGKLSKKNPAGVKAIPKSKTLLWPKPKK